MKSTINKIKKENKSIGAIILVVLFVFAFSSCSDDFLNEEPQDFLNSDVLLTTPEGYESAVIGLYESVRYLYFREDGSKMQGMFYGTDIATTGDRSLADFKDYTTWLTPTLFGAEWYWNWAYKHLMPRANTIIDHATNSANVFETEAEKNSVIAEARFFRAYAYNFIANLYGGAPIVDRIYDSPKLDFKRATREQVYDFARQDLEFAVQWLPETIEVDGRISKAAAYHLLSEVYISLGMNDLAVESASSVIDRSPHRLITERFGSYASEEGDVFSDLHAQGNQNPSTGNTETIWNLQFEPRTTQGGTVGSGRWNAVTWLRAWGPKWWDIKDPEGESGMELSVDSLGRGVAWVRPTNYFSYDVWKGNNSDIRNSKFNIRRDYVYNNTASSYYGQEVEYATSIDSMVQYYPMIRKIEGTAELIEGATYGRAFKDVYLMRLAETYLLRAEAYFNLEEYQKAADDINEVRTRANAPLIDDVDVSLDFILDERARELVIEENRRLTLSRMGKLVERTREYNPQSGPSIKDYHNVYPVPQTTIDANIEAKMEQNPGYPN